MIRPQVANAVLMSILFATLAGGAILMITGAPELRRHVAAAVRSCELSAQAVFEARAR
ncbi:hypothetical protein [Methylocystis echinoides]|jgi:hypothetical protein|uniref:Uncharacterized protein n=1 Tax=Methylocystis echinoides TaxID=29468 RepID=A0A9W6LQJ0_9HYPH|nr:hypothetical protein [Methylocystis echinoides]GLI91416.1 hypothetical protein LMG27198_04080 [Methylocystis echinoides]